MLARYSRPQWHSGKVHTQQPTTGSQFKSHLGQLQLFCKVHTDWLGLCGVRTDMWGTVKCCKTPLEEETLSLSHIISILRVWP